MKKPFLIVVVATLVLSVFIYFGYTPDVEMATGLASRGQDVVDAFTARTWALALKSIVALAGFIWAQFFRRSE